MTLGLQIMIIQPLSFNAIQILLLSDMALLLQLGSRLSDVDSLLVDTLFPTTPLRNKSLT